MSDPQDGTSYALDALHRTLDEVSRADTKAGILLAALGVGAGSFLNSVASGGGTPPLGGVVVGLFWWGAMVAFTVAIGLLVAAIAPRVQHTITRRAKTIYFGELAKARDLSHMESLLPENLDQYRLAVVDSLWWVSRAARRKYVLIQAALACACLGLAALFTLAVLVAA